MLSKKFSCNWFHFGIWRKQTFRYWPLWAGYLGIWMLIAPNMLNGYYYEPESIGNGLNFQTFYFGRGVIMSLNGAAAGIAFYAGLVAMAVYSYLYNSRSVNLFHALPVRRETLFATNFITGLGFIVGPNLIVAGYFAVLQVVNDAVGDIVPLLTWIAVTTLVAIFFFGLATLCAVGTGTVLMLPVLYGIFNFLVVTVESVLRWLASMFLWGLTSSSVQFYKWSPLTYIMDNGLENNRNECIEYLNGMSKIHSYVRFTDWGYVVLLGLVGVAFAALALFLYRRWQSESAGDLIAFEFLRPVFTYAWAAGCSLMLGSGLFVLLSEGSFLGVFFGYHSPDYGQLGTGGAIVFVLCMLLGGTIGFFSAKMLHKKSFRVFAKKDWRGYAAFVVALLVVVLCIKLDVLGVEHWTPDVDDLTSFSFNGTTTELETDADREEAAQYIRIHQAILAQKKTLQAQLEQDVDYETSFVESVRLRYTLKDGKRVERLYYVRVDRDLVKDPSTPVGMLYELSEGVEKRMERSGLNKLDMLDAAKLYVYYTPKDPDVYESVDLYVDREHPEKLASLLEALKKDVVDGEIGAGDMFLRLYKNDKDYGREDMWAEVMLYDVNGLGMDFYISENTPNTLAWVQAELAAYLDKIGQNKPLTDEDIMAGVQ